MPRTSNRFSPVCGNGCGRRRATAVCCHGRRSRSAAALRCISPALGVAFLLRHRKAFAATLMLAAMVAGFALAAVRTAWLVHPVLAHPINELVDTTGAGDLFAAGFLFGLVRGASYADAGRLGHGIGLLEAEIGQQRQCPAHQRL